MKTKYLTQKLNLFYFHDKTNGYNVYCQIRQRTEKAFGKGSCLGPHMNIYDSHRCLLPSRNPVGNSCNLQDMGPNNYVFGNNSDNSAFHKPDIAPTDKIHWIASPAILHSTAVEITYTKCMAFKSIKTKYAVLCTFNKLNMLSYVQLTN
jgi:hypothetical protein